MLLNSHSLRPSRVEGPTEQQWEEPPVAAPTKRKATPVKGPTKKKSKYNEGPSNLELQKSVESLQQQVSSLVSLISTMVADKRQNSVAISVPIYDASYGGSSSNGHKVNDTPALTPVVAAVQAVPAVTSEAAVDAGVVGTEAGAVESTSSLNRQAGVPSTGSRPLLAAISQVLTAPEVISITPVDTSPAVTAYAGTVTQSTESNILLSSGVPAGYSVADAIKRKIWTHKFLDFYDLINHNDPSYYELKINTDSSTPSLTIENRKKRTLSETEWCQAWDEFVAVYCLKYPSELSQLLSYGKHIKLLMRQGNNWSFYDAQFRKDREFLRCSWAVVRVDLQIAAVQQMNTANHSRYVPQQTFQVNRISRVPKSFCYRYHNEH